MSVYFLQVGEDGPIKIGTSEDVASRVAALRTASHAKLRLLAKVPGGIAEEHALHKRFARSRLEGEWFRPTVNLCAHICNLAGAFPAGSVEILAESALQRFARAEIDWLRREISRADDDPERLPPLTADEDARYPTIDFSALARVRSRTELEQVAADLTRVVGDWPAGSSAAPYLGQLRVTVDHLGARSSARAADETAPEDA